VKNEISGFKNSRGKELFYTLLKIESEKCYKTASYNWWNTPVYNSALGSFNCKTVQVHPY
jgi:hypothetical protein